jgi:hypothetical protein
MIARELVEVARVLVGGAVEFGGYAAGSDASRSFDALVRSAKEEDGDDGYTGTIAEKSKFKMVSEPVTKEEARKLMHEMIGRADKWGPAFCIPVVEGKGSSKVIGHYFFGLASE